MNDQRDQAVPWATGLAVAGFVAAVIAVAVVVLSLGLIRVHPLLAVGLNIVAGQRVGPYAVGLAPHPSAALVRAWRGSGRGGRVVGAARLDVGGRLATPA